MRRLNATDVRGEPIQLPWSTVGNTLLVRGCACLCSGHCPSSPVTALSLSGCFLNDADLSPLMGALGSGFKLHMLKLSANRLTDATVRSLAENLRRCATHPLSVLDISGNQVRWRTLISGSSKACRRIYCVCHVVRTGTLGFMTAPQKQGICYIYSNTGVENHPD